MAVDCLRARLACLDPPLGIHGHSHGHWEALVLATLKEEFGQLGSENMEFCLGIFGACWSCGDLCGTEAF
ncbi:hypothetical protein ACP70R_018064 [Stipagrostis hirtigluma subsp. patula]